MGDYTAEPTADELAEALNLPKGKYSLADSAEGKEVHCRVEALGKYLVSGSAPKPKPSSKPKAD